MLWIDLGGPLSWDLQRLRHSYGDKQFHLLCSIDASLEDEELLADQLKEYLFFAYALQNLCKNHEMMQLQLEDAEDSVTNKNTERNRVQLGKTGLMSKLFGAVDTEEVREYKVSLLDQQIQDGVMTVNNAKDGLW